jgi:predicted nucleotide-binding protein (sugar kinase/HSP70/actin superfamily)
MDEELMFRMERDQMYYRERAVDHALELNKQNEQNASVESLMHNANAIYNFIKGKSNE